MGWGFGRKEEVVDEAWIRNVIEQELRLAYQLGYTDGVNGRPNLNEESHDG